MAKGLEIIRFSGFDAFTAFASFKDRLRVKVRKINPKQTVLNWGLQQWYLTVQGKL